MFNVVIYYCYLLLPSFFFLPLLPSPDLLTPFDSTSKPPYITFLPILFSLFAPRVIYSSIVGSCKSLSKALGGITKKKDEVENVKGACASSNNLREINFTRFQFQSSLLGPESPLLSSPFHSLPPFIPLPPNLQLC